MSDIRGPCRPWRELGFVLGGLEARQLLRQSVLCPGLFERLTLAALWWTDCREVRVEGRKAARGRVLVWAGKRCWVNLDQGGG